MTRCTHCENTGVVHENIQTNVLRFECFCELHDGIKISQVQVHHFDLAALVLSRLSILLLQLLLQGFSPLLTPTCEKEVTASPCKLDSSGLANAARASRHHNVHASKIRHVPYRLHLRNGPALPSLQGKERFFSERKKKKKKKFKEIRINERRRRGKRMFQLTCSTTSSVTST